MRARGVLLLRGERSQCRVFSQPASHRKPTSLHTPTFAAPKPAGSLFGAGGLGGATTTSAFQTPSLSLGGLGGTSAFQTPAQQAAQPPQTPGTLSAATASLHLTNQNVYPMLSAVKKQEQLRQQQQDQQQKAAASEKKPAVSATPHFVYTPPSATRIRARVFNVCRCSTFSPIHVLLCVQSSFAPCRRLVSPSPVLFASPQTARVTCFSFPTPRSCPFPHVPRMLRRRSPSRSRRRTGSSSSSSRLTATSGPSTRPRLRPRPAPTTALCRATSTTPRSSQGAYIPAY